MLDEQAISGFKHWTLQLLGSFVGWLDASNMAVLLRILGCQVCCSFSGTLKRFASAGMKKYGVTCAGSDQYGYYRITHAAQAPCPPLLSDMVDTLCMATIALRSMRGVDNL